MWLFLATALASHAFAQADTDLKPDAARAWDQYLQWVDGRVQRELGDISRFLIEDFLPPTEASAVRRALERGETYVERMPRAAPPGVKFEVPDAEIHHWWGCILVPGISLRDLTNFVQDYDHHAGKFADVARSKLLSREENLFKFYFRLRRTKSFVTVQYNCEQECVYENRGPGRMSSRSLATRIAEIENPDTPSEREKPLGRDRGFLWRLASWWRFKETSRGVIVECESASLSRDIPVIIRLMWPIAAYIRSTPKDSLESVLIGIRTQLKGR